ncbi:MAG TPA: hypothetical protein VLV49_11760 [Terriglobales bacterium]|nr:hypothetical protein [Terriglobales bacterium]
MVLGMSLATYTAIHVIISLVGIGSGLIVMFGLLTGNRMNGMTAIFLITTALTSLTGFGFPFTHLLPSHILGIISLVTLAAAIPARYLFHMAGPWRWVYVIGSTMALYFNCFVLVVQSFEKVQPLKALAPTQKEPPFVITQLVVLLIFATLGVLATVRFHPQEARAAA